MRATMLWALLSDETGEVFVSYGLIASMISIVAVVGFSQLGLSTAGLFDWITSVITSKS